MNPSNLTHSQKFYIDVDLILAIFWDMVCITIHEDYKVWKYEQNWTREFWVKGFFQFFYLIEAGLFQFLTYFRYSALLVL